MVMRRYYVVSFVVVCFALSFLPASLNAAQSVDTNVLNTETNPVPVKNVNTETNPVPVKNVNTETNPLPVKNVNTETNPVPTYNIEHPAKIDFKALCNMPLGANNQTDECSIDVPAGERYIVEFVSASCVTFSSTDSFFKLVVYSYPVAFHLFGLEFLGVVDNDFYHYGNSQLVKFSSDDQSPGVDMNFILYHKPLVPPNSGSCSVTINGYKIPHP